MSSVVVLEYLLEALALLTSIELTPLNWCLFVLQAAKQESHEFMTVMLHDRLELLGD